MKRKQISIVLEALAKGPATSREIAQACGIRLASVSAYLHELSVRGAIEKSGEWRPHRQRGRALIIWKLIDQASGTAQHLNALIRTPLVR